MAARWAAGARALLAVLALALLSACAAPTKDLVVLMPGADGKVGMVTVQQKSGAPVTLDQALQGARIDREGRVETATIAQVDVERTFADAIQARPQPPTSFTLYFEEGSDVLTRASQPEIEKLFQEIARRRVAEVQVTGHTDRKGSDADNDRLSRERAALVRRFLISRGIQEGMIIAVGRGEREPLVPTPDGADEPRNRRAEVTVR